VAGGIAEHLDVSATLVRVVFVIVAIASFGAALAGYAAAWLLLPDDLGTEPVGHDWYRRHGAHAASIAAVVVAALVGLAILRFVLDLAWGWHGPDAGLLVLIGLAGVAIASRNDPQRRPRRPHGDEASAPREPEGNGEDQTTVLGADWSDPTAIQDVTTAHAPAVEREPVDPEVLQRRRLHRRARWGTLAASLASGASAALLWATGAWSVGGWVVPAAMLACLVVGLAAAPWVGWSWTLTLAALFVIVLLAISAVPGVTLRGGVGRRYAQPTDAREATAHAFRLGAGQQVVDLTALAVEPGTSTQVRAGVGAGSLELRVPSDITLVVRGHLSAGDVRVDDRDTDLQGTDLDIDRIFPARTGDRDAARVVVHVDSGFGDIHVVHDA
jgi:phage shock protein PspC (stress-responsive transcriptional regulator)